MVSDHAKGIFVVMHRLRLEPQMMIDPAAEYVAAYNVEAVMRARWQHSTAEPRLLDWTLSQLWVEGKLCGVPESDFPENFPFQGIVNACTISSLMRRKLETMGPGVMA
jgi:hypothetical protein